ncbi:kelch-like protein 41a [Drosophila kikkawai]|uniref:Kelch-like protein 41a n=1 Tax=Drosophila kikkawai TaxID=30033 RepID=A0A6P4IJH9_DROKI|nr:kelch repeat and BTB domain-containing protein 4 [Drosophila kikkawai]
METTPWTKKGADLLKSGLFSDICIRVENTCFKCHKIILACASEFFEKLFQKDGLETGNVVLEGTTPEVFEIFLNYIYTMDKEFLKSVELDHLLSLMKCANMWLAAEVENVCPEIIVETCVISGINEKRLIQIYEVSYQVNNESLMNWIISILKKDDAMDLQESAKLGIDCFMEYFQHTSEMEESKRFGLLEMWMHQNCLEDEGFVFSLRENSKAKNKNEKSFPAFEKISLMLSSIDFEKMTLKEFHNGPGRSIFISDTDKVDTIYGIAKKVIDSSFTAL